MIQNLDIVILNALTALILLFACNILVYRYLRTKRTGLLFMAFAVLMLVLGAVVNILEHAKLIDGVNQFEEIVGVLFLPILIFSIHSAIIRNELTRRRESESKFKGIFEESFSYIGLLSPSGILLEANSTSKKLIRQEKDIIGKHFAETQWWTHSQKEREKILLAIAEAQKGKIIRFESSHIDKKGQIHYVDFSIKPIINENNEVLYLIPEARDITELKLARTELEKHKNQLEELVEERTRELNKKNTDLENTLLELHKTQQNLIESEKMASLGILTAGVAHEINNPLNFIQGGHRGLVNHLENSGSLDEQSKILLDHIKQGVERSATIVDSLNQFSRNKETFDELCDIHEILEGCLLILNNKLDKINVVTNLDAIPSVAPGNVGKLHQVFLNIINNAIQALNNQGEIRIKTATFDSLLHIYIEDNGVGIAKEDLGRVIDPFFTTKDPGQGTGLGLSIVYSIIQDHGGTIEIESELDKGTQLIVKLPLDKRI